MADSAMNGGNFAHNNTSAPTETKIMSLFSLKGRTAIISGAGAGIGLAIAHCFAEAGANVAIWYNSNKKALDRAAEIEKEYGVKCEELPPRVFPLSSSPCLNHISPKFTFHFPLSNLNPQPPGKAYQVNVQDPEAVDQAIRTQISEFNDRLDIFVANSGIPWTQGAMIDGELEHYRKVVTTDLDGTFYCARTCGAVWREQKQKGTVENFKTGSFIATASMSGHVVNIPQLQAAYNAAKAGVIHLCRSSRVGAVCAGEYRVARVYRHRDQ
jgi:sorbose reductase